MKLCLKVAGAIGAACAIGIPVAAVSAHPKYAGGRATRSQIKHVLLISVDGMHQSDLDWYVANHPNSELAKLASGGASTPTRTPRIPRTPTRAEPR